MPAPPAGRPREVVIELAERLSGVHDVSLVNAARPGNGEWVAAEWLRFG